MKFFIGALLFICSQTILAATKDDFAYGYEVMTNGQSAIYSLDLNETIYKGLTHHDRRDLRVFNNDNEIVPHLIRSKEKKATQATSPVKLAFFPIYKNTPSDTLDAVSQRIRINTNAQGAIIDLNYAENKKTTPLLAGYIIDISSIIKEHAKSKPLPDKLTVNWKNSNPNFIKTVRLEGSNDLSRWHNVVSKATLSNMQWQHHTLIQRDITLPVRLPRYLRLSWRQESTASNEALDITSLVAHFPDSTQSQKRRWTMLRSIRNVDDATYLFNSESVLPVDRLNVQLSDNNSLLNVKIESAPTKKGPWYKRYQGLIYNLQFSQNNLRNPNIHISGTTHRHWRVQLLDYEGELNEQPLLQLGWLAEELLFVANGKPPFILAYGSALTDIKKQDDALYTLLKLTPDSAQAAQLGRKIELGGAIKLKKSPAPLDWKNYILWVVLVSGVGLLGFLVLRLYRQMAQVDSEK